MVWLLLAQQRGQTGQSLTGKELKSGSKRTDTLTFLSTKGGKQTKNPNKIWICPGFGWNEQALPLISPLNEEKKKSYTERTRSRQNLGSGRRQGGVEPPVLLPVVLDHQRASVACRVDNELALAKRYRTPFPSLFRFWRGGNQNHRYLNPLLNDRWNDY